MSTQRPNSVSSEDETSATIERLLDQYTEIARLAGSLAHEIKNPLSTIRLNMELLAEDLGEPQTPAQRRAVKRIDVVRQECQRLQALLDDFLSYAKVRRLHLEPSDLNHQINDVVDFFAPEAAAAGVEIVRYLDPDLPRVLLDRETFRRALLNLILNAKQAMPDGGQLVVRTAASGEMVAVYLIDNGVGMDEHTASKMFEAFFSTKPAGSGLGLPTTQKIIAAHGGRINVQSELGRGRRSQLSCRCRRGLGGNDVPVINSDGGAIARYNSRDEVIAMALTIELPAEVESSLRAQSPNLDAEAKEALLVELYRQERLTRYEFSLALGISRFETDAVLNKHQVTVDLPTSEELERDLQLLRELVDR